jgi:glycosyltransferase involved in cell wall biosynthesis
MTEFRPCIIVPVYNHGISAAESVARLTDLGLTVFVVDDGSTVEAEALDEMATHSLVAFVRHKENMGKGAAVMTGFRTAKIGGFTHAVQIDADGQHAVEDIPEFLRRAEAEPEAVICGCPVYDASVPMGRLIGRYVTHVWVWIETLSFGIKDSMCGFRVYPLASTVPVLDQAGLGRRMDFDPEILVRLAWKGVTIRSVPTQVIYPEGGRSNFRLVADNWLITLMHTRLFFGMLLRLPRLIAQKFT